MDAFCMVSDSGTLPEESSFYLSVGRPIPVGCIRTSTERPEALDKGCFVLSGIDEVGLLQSVDLAIEMVRNGDLGVPVPDYVDENVSDKVVRIVQSYVGVVNKMVWRKGMGLAADHPTLQPIRTFFGWVLSETAGACAPALTGRRRSLPAKVLVRRAKPNVTPPRNTPPVALLRTNTVRLSRNRWKRSRNTCGHAITTYSKYESWNTIWAYDYAEQYS